MLRQLVISSGRLAEITVRRNLSSCGTRAGEVLSACHRLMDKLPPSPSSDRKAVARLATTILSRTDGGDPAARESLRVLVEKSKILPEVPSAYSAGQKIGLSESTVKGIIREMSGLDCSITPAENHFVRLWYEVAATLKKSFDCDRTEISETDLVKSIADEIKKKFGDSDELEANAKIIDEAIEEMYASVIMATRDKAPLPRVFGGLDLAVAARYGQKFGRIQEARLNYYLSK